jgi:hypothetical protein
MTLGQALAAKVRLIVWCKSCGHRAEPAVAELIAHHGATMTVIDWAARLACSNCGARDADFVVTGSHR